MDKDEYFLGLTQKVLGRLSPEEAKVLAEDIIKSSCKSEDEAKSLRVRLYKIFCIRS